MKEYYTSGVGADQELKENSNNVVETFKSKDDIILGQLEEGQIVATTDDTVEISDIQEIITNNVTDSVERLIENSGIPVGTISSVKTHTNPIGWLKCDGSKFSTAKYPFLYSALRSDTLPFEIQADDWELDKELFTGETFFGKPVYSFSFYDNVTRSTSWAVMSVGSDAYFPYTHDVKNIVKIEGTTSHNGTYRNGTITNYLFEITGTALDAATQLYKPTATSQLMVYYGHQAYYDSGSPKLFTIYYTKNEDDLTNAKFKFIKAISGATDSEESAEVVDAINQFKSALVDTSSVPCGTVINGKFATIPEGYLKCDGSEFDPDEFPVLYAKLNNSNKLPIVFDKNSLSTEPDFMGTHRTNGYIGSRQNYDTVEAIFRAAGIAHDQDGFEKDGWLYYQSAIWEMLYIENPDGTNYCVAQVPYTDSEATTAMIPIKKGQKIYALMRTSDATVTPGHYENPNYTYINIWYYSDYSYIKAYSGVHEGAEADAVVTALHEYKEKLVDTSGVPCGTIVFGKYNVPPEGYLKADGSEFDPDDYPILYTKLGNKNVLPTVFDPTSLPSQPSFRGTTRNNGYKGDMPLYGSCLALLEAADIDSSGNGFKKDGFMAFESYLWKMIWILDTDGSIFCLGQYPISDNQSGSTTWHFKKGQKIWAITTNGGSANTLPPQGTYDNNIYYYINIWYYEDYAYIKAFSGVNEGEEATAVVDAINELKSRVAYSSLPLGNIIQLNNNSVTPAGYLLADGRDTTGTIDELETKYPLLYSYLGNSNILPEIGDELDYEHPQYLTYTGSQGNESTPNVQDTNYTMDKAGMFIGNFTGFNGACGWILVNGIVIDKMSSHSGTWLNDSTVCIPVKKGDVVTVHMGYTGNYSWYNYQTFIPYKTFKYIKAVTGVEDGAESTTVANAISTATTALQNNYDSFVDEVRNSERWTEYVLWEATNTATNIVANTTFTDSLNNYEEIKFYCRRSASIGSEPVPVYSIDHRMLQDMYLSTGTYNILIPGYGSEYRQLKITNDGMNVTAVAGGQCLYRVVGVGKRS